MPLCREVMTKCETFQKFEATARFFKQQTENKYNRQQSNTIAE